MFDCAFGSVSLLTTAYGALSEGGDRDAIMNLTQKTTTAEMS